MGLAERRALKAFQDTKFASLKADIDAAAGFPVELEVKWDTLAREGESGNYDAEWPNIYFVPLALAFKKICVDDLGKDALRSGLRKIVVQNTEDRYSEAKCAQFSDGVLTFDYGLYNSSTYEQRARAVVEVLEKAL